MLLFLPSYHLYSKFPLSMIAKINTAETSAEATTNDIDKQRAYVRS